MRWLRWLIQQASPILVVLVLIGVLMPGSTEAWGTAGTAQNAGLAHDTSPGNSGEHKTTICHATGSASNPSVLITVDDNALKAHQAHQDGKDIIPAPAGGCPGAASPTKTKTPTPAPATKTKTPTPTNVVLPTEIVKTNTPTVTSTAPASSTPTKTNTPVVTNTNTPIPTSTNTPTKTNTPVPPTNTNTPVPPTSTNTAVPPTSTNTPTKTNTPVPPTNTNTPIPPTNTNTPVPTNTNTPVPNTATKTNTPTSTSTVLPTEVARTSTATATATPVRGFLEICKIAGDDVAVGQIFSFTLSSGGSASVAAGTANVPICTAPMALPPGNVTITEQAASGVTLAGITVDPADRQVSLDLGARQVTVRVIAGDESTSTQVFFTNVGNELKICKVAGSGVFTGQVFIFTVSGGGAGTATFLVPAGFCALPISSFIGGTNVTVVETIPTGISVSAITAAPADRLVSANLTTGTGVVRIGTGESVLFFTNQRAG